MKIDELKIAMAQISPVLLNKIATLKKVENSILEAASNQCDLIVFGESLVPGYPFWVALTNGADWNTKISKRVACCLRY